MYNGPSGPRILLTMTVSSAHIAVAANIAPTAAQIILLTFILILSFQRRLDATLFGARADAECIGFASGVSVTSDQRRIRTAVGLAPVGLGLSRTNLSHQSVARDKKPGLERERKPGRGPLQPTRLGPTCHQRCNQHWQNEQVSADPIAGLPTLEIIPVGKVRHHRHRVGHAESGKE